MFLNISTEIVDLNLSLTYFKTRYSTNKIPRHINLDKKPVFTEQVIYITKESIIGLFFRNIVI